MERNGTMWAILGAIVIVALVGWVMMTGKPVTTSETAAPANTSESSGTTPPAPAPAPAEQPAAPAPAPAEQPAAPAPAPAAPVQPAQ